ncbi:MAG: efflux RND transporter periplasmic adaptor subunit, partial [Planctomycetota bacterium]
AAPALLDARARAQAEARVQAAEAAVLRAGAEIARARSTLDFAEDELARSKSASGRGATSPIEMAAKEMLQRRAVEEYRSAEFAEDIAQFELEQARGALLATQAAADPETALEIFPIRSPINGRVLRVLQESMAVVTPGTPLLELGDETDLEIVVDVLSADAVRIEPGSLVLIEHWGGAETLFARVRLVEPSAFTKISALGVEEQRVNVIADFQSPLEDRRTMGDGFRVEVRIVLWEERSVVQVPTGALFRLREQQRWAVFALEGGRAVRREVEIGQQNGLSAQVVSGLKPGDQVVIHPSDRVRDGVRIRSRGG